MTKLSHVHLCAADAYAARILQLGEEPWRVHVTGTPALDRLRAAAAIERSELEARLRVPLDPPFGVLTYHPPTAQPERLDAELHGVLAGCDALRTVIATYPGADPQADTIVPRLREWSSERSGVLLVPSLGAAVSGVRRARRRGRRELVERHRGSTDARHARDQRR